MTNVLFLCTGNSARSIIAETLLNDLGGGRFAASSAGSNPAGSVARGAERVLLSQGHRTADLESKSWDHFGGPEAPAFDVVITVCSAAAGETCPIWNGSPTTAHWGLPDPAGASGDTADVDAAFAEAYDRLRARIQALVALPVESMSAVELEKALRSIGRSDHAASEAR